MMVTDPFSGLQPVSVKPAGPRTEQRVVPGSEPHTEIVYGDDDFGTHRRSDNRVTVAIRTSEELSKLGNPNFLTMARQIISSPSVTRMATAAARELGLSNPVITNEFEKTVPLVDFSLPTNGDFQAKSPVGYLRTIIVKERHAP